MMPTRRDRRPLSTRELLHGLDVQRHVIGALILRELHTRFGRDNIGYLWIIAEPMILAGAVAILHGGSSTHLDLNVRPVPMALGGYCGFMLFRSIVTRAEGALHSNRPLLYHRMVTIFDMLAARAALEFVAISAAFVILLTSVWMLGLGDFPVRPLTVLAAIVLMTWWSFALSLLVCAGCHTSRVMERLLHPVTYLLMPLSGAFFMLKWLPEPYRTWLSWFPMTQIFELLRYGQFNGTDDHYVELFYIIGWCLTLTFVGLISIQITRRHVHLS